MHSELEQLLVLQDRQQKIRQIENEIKTLPLQRTSLDGQLASTLSGLENLKHRGKQLEVDRKRLELDAETRRTSIARLRTQQYETRKNDEFQAIGHEIERYEKEITGIEDQELELMDQGDKVKAEVGTEEKKTAATKESIARQMADLEEKGKALQHRLEELKKERDEIAGKIDEDLLERFERLFESKGDAAVAAVEHGVCTGCHMKLTTATVKGVESGREIVSCEQCGRILYQPTG